MKNLIIIGTGGHGKDVLDTVNEICEWEKIAFLDDKNESYPELGIKTIGRICDAQKFVNEFEYAFVAIGKNDIRLELIKHIKELGYKIPTLIHPKAIISKSVVISEGSIVLAGAVINTFAKLGIGAIVNIASSIGHESILEDGVQVSPGANVGGCSRIGKLSWICIGANVINNVVICEKSIIGAGSVVVKDIEFSGTYVGIPAKKIK